MRQIEQESKVRMQKRQKALLVGITISTLLFVIIQCFQLDNSTGITEYDILLLHLVVALNFRWSAIQIAQFIDFLKWLILVLDAVLIWLLWQRNRTRKDKAM